MHKVTRSPSLVQDIGALAGLYRNVFWMMGHKERWPQVWPRADASRLPTMDAEDSSGERSDEAVGAKQ